MTTSSNGRDARIVRLLQLVAALLVGMLLGAGIMVLQTGHRLERAHIERGQLLSQLQWYRARVTRLSDQLNAERWIVVEEVTLVLQGVEEQSADALFLRQELTPFLEQLLGQHVADVDPALVSSVFDGRVLEQNKTRYTLRTRTLILARTTELVLSVETRDINRPDQSE